MTSFKYYHSFLPSRNQPTQLFFGIGARKCPASKLSRALVSCYYFYLLSHFSFTLVSSSKKKEQKKDGEKKVRKRLKGGTKKPDEDGVIDKDDKESDVAPDVDIQPEVTPHYGFYTRPKEEVWLTFHNL